MTLQIIGAGLGRTGTSSLKAALEELGFGPCYHMTEVIKHPTHAKTWEKATQGHPVDWHDLFAGYQSAVDYPACSFYKELMDVYPDAKVILSVREPERWYESAYETIYLTLQEVPPWSRWLPWVNDIYRMTNLLIWDGQFEGRFEDRAYAIDVFNQWNAEVQAVVPPERLLIFDVKQGWEPLCAFLGVEVPSRPFPHANRRVKMVLGRHLLRAIRRGLPLAFAASVVLAILWALAVLYRRTA
jgi:hypothetical protein